MEQAAAAEKAQTSTGARIKESLLRRKYVIPFVLACVILACNQATGINSIIGYNTNILLQSGLSDVEAHWGYVLFTIVNFLMTIGGVTAGGSQRTQVPAVGRHAGIIVSLSAPACSFGRPNGCAWIPRSQVQSMVTPTRRSRCCMTRKLANAARGQRRCRPPNLGTQPTSLVVIYSYGDFHAATKVRVPTIPPPSRSRSPAKAACPPTKWSRFFRIPSPISMPRARLR
jgi:MFS transporter, SP family, solute carrier family 2 (myo-inositol transporter), member 13